MTRVEIVLFAARLIGVSVALLLVPGLLLLSTLRVRTEWPERVAVAFALSYGWIFVLSILVPLAGWTADAAAVLTILVIFGLGGAALRRRVDPSLAPSQPFYWLLIAVIVALAFAAWVIESPFTGEEVLDLASIARFADGGPISFFNTSLLPDARPVYVVQPYQLALGLIARWSATEPLIAFVKFRIVLVPLASIFVFALVRRLAPNRSDALAAFAVIVLFVALDFETWEMNSLFPLVRRGGAGAGLCVPVMLLLSVLATRRSAADPPDLLRPVALATAPIMLAASLATHPLEMFTVLCFIVAMWVAIMAGLDREGDRRRALILTCLMAATAATYLSVQSRLVPYVAEYEEDEKQSRRDELAGFAHDPLAALVGRPAPGEDMLTRTIPNTSALVFGTLALPLTAVMAPAAAALLAAGIVPLALLYATPAGYLILTLLTSVETVRDVNAYFSLLGLIALALAVTAAAHIVLNAAASPAGTTAHLIKRAFVISIAGWVILVTMRAAARLLVAATLEPRIMLAAAAAAAVGALAVARRERGSLLRPAPFPTGVAVVAVCLAIPLAQPEAGIGGAFVTRQPVDLIARFQIARMSASVLNWDDYYERLQETIAPPLPVPRRVVDELRRRIPPREIVLADPEYSCALVVLMNAYCINPVSIYGHYFQPAVSYYRGYVSGSGDSPEHPFFNTTTSLSEQERALIRDYHIKYVLTDPRYGDLIGSKLGQAVEDARLEMTLDGYALYRLIATEAKTADQ
jgi:hypothetical protein